MVPVDNKMIIYFFFLTNICLVLEAWLAAASSVWSTPELTFQCHKVGKAIPWRLRHTKQLGSCLPLTFALTKKRCSVIIAQETTIMLR